MSRLRVLLVVVPILAACATSKNLGFDDEDNGPGPGFTSPDQDASPDIDASSMLCVATQCPAPLMTCPGSSLCAVDPNTDVDHCGTCDNVCGTSHDNLLVGCVNGACVERCDSAFADCDGQPGDGCEASLSTDSNNCGACGVVCADDKSCVNGSCECTSFGTPECPCPATAPDHCPNLGCTNILSDAANCGACGTTCAPTVCTDHPETVSVGMNCAQGECVIACKRGSLDCDDDLELGCGLSNGCETPIDRNNCGACGRACAEAEDCIMGPPNVPEPSRSIGCYAADKCLPNEEWCIWTASDGLTTESRCTDPQSDIHNCGECGVRCDAFDNLLFEDVSQAHVVPACKHGVCQVDCESGWGDCDGDPNNGCETNLQTDGANCGGCGLACDTGHGQPCIRGACLMTECDGGGPQ